MLQAVDCNYCYLLITIFQHKYITKIETALNKTFSVLCDWFVENKLSVPFGEDKTNQFF